MSNKKFAPGKNNRNRNSAPEEVIETPAAEQVVEAPIADQVIEPTTEENALQDWVKTHGSEEVIETPAAEEVVESPAAEAKPAVKIAVRDLQPGQRFRYATSKAEWTCNSNTGSEVKMSKDGGKEWTVKKEKELAQEVVLIG